MPVATNSDSGQLPVPCHMRWHCVRMPVTASSFVSLFPWGRAGQPPNAEPPNTHACHLLQEQSSDCCLRALFPNSRLGSFQAAACKHCRQTLEFHYPLLHRNHSATYLRSYHITSGTAMAVKLPWEGRMLHNYLHKHQISKKTPLGQPEKYKMMGQGLIN